jgi:hypothetical protein
MAGVFLSALVAPVLVFLVLPVTTLSLKIGAAGSEAAAIRVDSGSCLEIEYIHSMYGVCQSEVFSIDREPVFHLKKVLFGSLAAALYYDPDPPSGLTFRDNSWVINGDGKRFTVLKYRVSATTRHLLKVMNLTIDLSALAGETDGLILVELEKRSRLKSLFIALKRKGLDLLVKIDAWIFCGADTAESMPQTPTAH